MKRYFLVFLAALLLVFCACAKAESEAVALLKASPEYGMIGKTYSEAENQFGPLSAVYIEADGCPLFLFEKTEIGFYFNGMEIPSTWDSYAATGVIPKAVAIRGIASTEPCTGVSGRVKDFGKTDIESYGIELSVLQSSYSEGLQKNVYTWTIASEGVDVQALCGTNETTITSNTVIRVQKTGTAPKTMPPAPSATPVTTPAYVEVVTPSPTPNYAVPYQQAKDYMARGNYVEALTLLSGLNGYLDSAKLMAECQREIVYQNATTQYNNRNYSEAEMLFESLGDFRDAEMWKLRARILPTKKGDRFKFGWYEQDDKTSAPEEIEWIVLARSGNKRLIISRYILTTLPFDKNHKVADDRSNIAEAGRVAAPWSKSSIRKWLNKDFLNEAFSEVEKSTIQTTRLTNDANPTFNIPGEGTTRDKIFLLSIAEAEKYFNTNRNRKALKTNYAKNIYPTGKRYGWWWLRSPGMHRDFAAIVLTSGGYSEASGDWQGRGASNPGGIRPAMWIDLT